MMDRMPRVDMYTTTTCPWCVRAKRLLSARGLAVEEIDVSDDRLPMMERAGGRMSVPQIFVDDVLVGGHDDLVQWIRDGRLDASISASSG
jgi:glutaredoxin 3